MADMKDIHKTAVSHPKKHGAIVVVPVLRAKKQKEATLGHQRNGGIGFVVLPERVRTNHGV